MHLSGGRSICISSSLLLLLALELVTAQRTFPYLYGERGNPNATFPIQEHFAPPDQEPNRPSFLFHDTGTFRFVEFYVHWCNVCRNFKPTFEKIATSIKQWNASIEIYAVSCAPNRPLCRALDIDSYPRFQVFVPGNKDAVEIPHSQVNPVTVLRKMGISVENTASVVVAHTKQRRPPGWVDWIGRWFTCETQPVYFSRSRDNLRHDVHKSFDYAMRHGVFVNSDTFLVTERAQVLRRFLELLKLTLPPAWDDLIRLVDHLLVNFDYVQRSEEYLFAVLDNHQRESKSPLNETWSLSCSKGVPEAGYTCGLWEMFHVMTVGVVQYNQNSAFDGLDVSEVADSVRNYIQHFFGCEECRRNFLRVYDACAFGRCERLVHLADPIELPLWLLELHNGVNRRLRRENRARNGRNAVFADELDVTWPSLSACKACWVNETMEVYNSSVMFRYLEHEYGHTSNPLLSSSDEFNSNELDSEVLGFSDGMSGSVRRLVARCVRILFGRGESVEESSRTSPNIVWWHGSHTDSSSGAEF